MLYIHGLIEPLALVITSKAANAHPSQPEESKRVDHSGLSGLRATKTATADRCLPLLSDLRLCSRTGTFAHSREPVY